MTGAYFTEKFCTAVYILAGSNGTLADRLIGAYRDSLMRILVHDDVPWPDLKERFIRLLDDLAPDGKVELEQNPSGLNRNGFPDAVEM